jgi:hypothetical protein
MARRIRAYSRFALHQVYSNKAAIMMAAVFVPAVVMRGDFSEVASGWDCAAPFHA